jgi:hypothetical protein
MSKQLDILELIAEGERLKQEGMLRAEIGAGEAWVKKAKELAIDFVRGLKTGQTFKIEDIRIHAYNNNLIWKPKSDRAWAVAKTALMKSGLIEHAGQVSVINPKAHGAWANLWRKK